MKHLPSCLLFLSATVYLTVSGSLDVITFLAIIACAICSVFCLTNKSLWALVGGVGLISTSLIMQVILSYKCLTCIKADMLILSAVICLSLLQTGRVRMPSRIMAGAMTAVMLCVILTTPLSSESSHNLISYDFSQHLEVNQLNGDNVKIDTSNTPALLFSPSCSACKDALSKIASMDSNGANWKLVLTSNTEKDIEKAQETLSKLGYTGHFYTYDWHGPVPTVIYTENNKTITTHSVNDIIPRLKSQL